MSDAINPVNPGTYECSTMFLRECETKMIDNPELSWADVLDDDQQICLFWVMREVIAATPSGVDPAEMFVVMIDYDGTFKVTVNDDHKTVEIDFIKEGN